MNKYNRFTPNQLRALGHSYYVDNISQYSDYLPPEDPKDYSTYGTEEIQRLLSIMFETAIDGHYPNFICPELSDNAPSEVRAFFHALSQQSVPVVMSAPDDDVAFDTIIPRDCSYAQYRDLTLGVISRYKESFDLQQQSQSQPSE